MLSALLLLFPADQEIKKFQGKWVCVYVEKDGRPIPQEGLEDLKHVEILIDVNKVILKEEGEVKKGWHIDFKVDPTQSPKTIDLSMSIDDTKPKTSLGIYKFEGDTLKISIIEPKKEPERATRFVTGPGSGNLLWHFKRK
jgi:uncharacterized protein (TIGR03067 family)